MERATFDDLIARKLAKDSKRGEIRDIYVPSLGKTLAFERPADAVAIRFLDELTADGDTASLYEAYKSMIYRCCPALQSVKLAAELGAVVPTDTVPMIMDIDDVLDVGAKLMIFLGLAKPKQGDAEDGETVEEKVKN